jgi:ribose-phosphate pyrophosphokinase
VLVGLALQRLNDAPIERIVVSDTIPNGQRLAPIHHKLEVLSIAPLLGEAVHRIHHDMSVSALFRRGASSKR